MIEIPVLVASAWNVLQPHLSVLLTVTAQEIGKKVPDAAQKVWELVKSRFESDPGAQKALTQLADEPGDADLQGQFRAQLKSLLKEDPAFLQELTRLLESAGGSSQATLTGDGAIAQGTCAKAVGAGGVLIEGSVTGDITTGKSS